MGRDTSKRVLSIQSHVVFGYVGGKAAVFPLQRLGYDVDVVNTVHFSNHSGYRRGEGHKANAAELNTMFEALERNELLFPTRLLTGYVPGAESLSAVAKLARKLRQEKPDIIYLLDPVMGDAGHLYVASDVIPVYREMLPLATIIAPNWFEVEILTEIKLKDLASLRQALRVLHDEYHVPNVVISSIPLNPWLFDTLPAAIRPADVDHILCITSATFSGFPPMVHGHCVPLIPGYSSGVGDLFSAVLLGHFESPTSSATNGLAVTNAESGSLKSDLDAQTPISVAAAHALATTHHVLRMTYEYSLSLPEEERLPTDDERDEAEPLRRVRRMRGRELRLVQNQDALVGVGVQITWMRSWKGFWD